jgi:hypothetical protein
LAADKKCNGGTQQAPKQSYSVVVELVRDGEPATEGVDKFIGCRPNTGNIVEMVALCDRVGHGQDKVEEVRLLYPEKKL